MDGMPDRPKTKIDWPRLRAITLSIFLVVLNWLWKAIKAVAWVLTIGFVTMLVFIGSVFFGKKK